MGVEAASAHSAGLALLGLGVFDLVHDGLLLLSLLALLGVEALLGSLVHHDLFEFFVAHVAAGLLELVLEGGDGLHVVLLLLVPLLLRERLDSLVELLVLLLALLLLELGDFGLLLHQAALDLAHMGVRLQHFSQEIVGSADWGLGLHEDAHALHHVLPGQVVEGDFSLDIVVDLEVSRSLGNLTGLLVGEGHVLHEGNLALLPDELA
mmetsp:Transcript_3569/g.5401  ORF Transcript_3569/g.5401 Transcript_3569/m.5401 type:complete len:208 (+) Transcript_3569:266-889(+)